MPVRGANDVSKSRGSVLRAHPQHEASSPQEDAAAHNSDRVPFVQPPLVQLESSDATKAELVKVVIAWLVKEGFSSSAQVLREEATAALREQYGQRKSVRSIIRSIDEKDWDAAQRQLRKLQSRLPAPATGSFSSTDGAGAGLAPLARALPFLLAQQQFLELVDGDDGQRAYAFFVRSVKPHEATVSREHFAKLNYILTCKTVADCAAVYPEYRSWTGERGRAQLLLYISKVAGDCLAQPYCRPGNITGGASGGEDPAAAADGGPSRDASASPGARSVCAKSLEEMAADALGLERVKREFPQLLRGYRTVTARSLAMPLESQLPPTEPVMRLDVAQIVAEAAGLHAISGAPLPAKLTACEPFLAAASIAVGCHDGRVYWVPLCPGDAHSEVGPDRNFSVGLAPHVATEAGATLIFAHRHAVKGMRRNLHRLLVWGGPQLAVLDLTACVTGHAGGDGPTLVGGLAGASSPLPATAHNETYAQASGAGHRRSDLTHLFTHSAEVTAACFFPCGTLVAAGLSDGTVIVWDILSGAKAFENTFTSAAPIVALQVNGTGTMYFAAAKNGTISVVDVCTGLLVNTLTAPVAGELASIALSPSSTLLLASHRGGAVCLWDVLLGRQLPYHFVGAEKTAKSAFPVSFGCLDTQVIAGTSDGCLHVWCIDPSMAGAEAAGYGLLGEGDSGHLLSWKPASSRGALVRPAALLPLHRAAIADIKREGNWLVTCAADGIVYVCGSV